MQEFDYFGKQEKKKDPNTFDYGSKLTTFTSYYEEEEEEDESTFFTRLGEKIKDLYDKEPPSPSLTKDARGSQLALDQRRALERMGPQGPPVPEPVAPIERPAPMPTPAQLTVRADTPDTGKYADSIMQAYQLAKTPAESLEVAWREKAIAQGLPLVDSVRDRIIDQMQTAPSDAGPKMEPFTPPENTFMPSPEQLTAPADTKMTHVEHDPTKDIDIGTMVGKGLSGTGFAVAEGTAKLAVGAIEHLPPWVAPPQMKETAKRELAALQSMRAWNEEFYGEADNMAEMLIEGGFRAGSELVLFLAPGYGAMKVLPALKGLYEARGAGALLKKVGVEVLTGAPLDAAIAASAPENSLTGFIAEKSGSQWWKETAASVGGRAVVDATLGTLFVGGMLSVGELYHQIAKNGKLGPLREAFVQQIKKLKKAKPETIEVLVKNAEDRVGIALPPTRIVGQEHTELLDHVLVPTDQIAVDATRFQFKADTDAAGASRLLEDVTFDINRAGAILIWKDPEDGLMYVVNGHHRLELANRSGAPEIFTRLSRAADASEARFQGAVENIVEGRGTPIDAAKIFREGAGGEKLTSEFVQDLVQTHNLPVRERLVWEGANLASLSDNMWSMLVNGNIRSNRALIIAETTLDHKEQEQLLKMVGDLKLKDKEIPDAYAELKRAAERVETTMDLFGTTQAQVSMVPERLSLIKFTKAKLSKDRKLLNYVSKGDRPAILEQRGIGEIRVGMAQEQAAVEAEAAAIFDVLSARSGGVNDLMNEYAIKLFDSPKKQHPKIRQEFYDAVTSHLSVRALSGAESLGRASGQGVADAPPQGAADAAETATAAKISPEQRKIIDHEHPKTDPDDLETTYTRQDDMFGKPSDTDATKQGTLFSDQDMAKSGLLETANKTIRMLEGGEARGALSAAESARLEQSRSVIRELRGEKMSGQDAVKANEDIDNANFTNDDLSQNEMFYSQGEEMAGSPSEKGWTLHELNPKPAETPPTTDIDPSSLKPHHRMEMIREVFEELGLPFFEGLRKMGRGTLGMYVIKPESVHLRNYDDLPTAFHETGHHIHKLFWGVTRKGNLSNRSILHAMGSDVVNTELRPLVAVEVPHPTKTLADGSPKMVWKPFISDGSPAEGWAELTRIWMEDPAAAFRQAPVSARYLERTLQDAWPGLYESLKGVRNDYHLWLQADAESRFAAHISKAPPRNFGIRDHARRALVNVVDDMAELVKAQDEILSVQERRRLRQLQSQLKYADNMAPARKAAKKKEIKELKKVIRNMEPETLRENPATLARLARGMSSAAGDFIEKGVVNFETAEKMSRGLEEILAPIRNNTERWDSFWRFALAKHAKELEAAGHHTGFEAKDITEILERYGGDAEFVGMLSEVQHFKTAMLQYLNQAGVISEQSIEAMLKKWPNHIPMFRLDDVQRWGKRISQGGEGGKFGHVFDPVKRLSREGSGLAIIDPYESIVRNTFAYTQVAARQRVSRGLALLANKHGAGSWVTPIHPPDNVTRIGVDELLNTMDKHAVRQELQDALRSGSSPNQEIQQIVHMLKDEPLAVKDALGTDFLAIFRPGDWFGPKGRDIISYLRPDGKRQWYRVDPELYSALMGLDRQQTEAWIRYASMPAGWLRVGATTTPEFPLRNAIRDTMVAFVQSNYGFRPGWDSIAGITHILRKDKQYEMFRAYGGEFAALVDMDRNALRESLHKWQASGSLDRVIKNPWELLRSWSALMENATRMGEFTRAVSSLESQGLKGGELYGRAAAAAREVSVDFARHGAKTEGLRLLSAFWNARIQGYARLMREFKTHPERAVTKAFTGITLPSMYLYYANRDDPEYWALPDWERNLFWHVKIGGDFWKIPKPFELGIVFGTMPERMMAALDTNDYEGMTDAFREHLVADMIGTALPTPTAFVAPVENYFNFSLFLERKIVPRAQEDIWPELQHRQTTSQWAQEAAKFSARILGEGKGLSAPKIDNLVRGYFGGMGRLVSEGVDLAIPGGSAQGEQPTPSSTAQGIPVLGRAFVSRKPNFSSQWVEQFYEEWGVAASTKNTGDWKLKTDDPEYDQWILGQEQQIERYWELKSYHADLRALDIEATFIRNERSLTGEQKRDQLMEIAREKDRIAIEALGGEAVPVKRPGMLDSIFSRGEDEREPSFR